MTPAAVSFRGPPLTRPTRDALSAAGITMIEHHSAPGWGGQLREYLVSVDARDARDAVARVRTAEIKQTRTRGPGTKPTLALPPLFSPKEAWLHREEAFRTLDFDDFVVVDAQLDAGLRLGEELCADRDLDPAAAGAVPCRLTSGYLNGPVWFT